MSLSKKFLTVAFAMFMLAVGLPYEASAQTRRGVVVRRPIIVRQYVYRDPFWRDRYWGYSPYYSNNYYYSPYQQLQEQRYYLQRELAGNRRELAKHQREYRSDGVLTAKERRELADDIKDVRNSEAKLRQFNRYYVGAY